MTEAAWEACTNPNWLAEWYRKNHTSWLQRLGQKLAPRFGGRTRKNLLLAIAFARHYWASLNENHRRQVIVAEGTIDRAVLAGESAAVESTFFLPELILQWCHEDLRSVQLSRLKGYYWTQEQEELLEARLHQQEAAWCTIFRDVYGHLFYSARRDMVWLAWNYGAITALAQAIYDDRAFDRLPILADALEDATCHDAAILEHCRGGGEHARGCWVVDLLLGKE